MRHTLAITLLAAVLACRKDQPPAELNMADEPGLRPLPADAVIRVIRTPCYGACPVFSLTLLESGEVIFEGKANVRFVGRVSKHVDPSIVRTLVSRFQRSAFPRMETYYSSGHLSCSAYTTDQPGTITSVRLGKTTKTVYYNRGCASRPELYELSRHEEEVERAVGIAEWVGLA